MSREPGKLMQWLSKLIPQPNGVNNLTPSEPKRTLKEEDFRAEGVYYYEDNIRKLACPNPEWKKSAAKIIEEFLSIITSIVLLNFWNSPPIPMTPMP